jgi:DNA polymerase-4
MERLGIRTGADLRACDLVFLQQHFRSSAEYLYGAARGEDHRPVCPDRPLKSVGAERTFDTDLKQEMELREALERVADAAWARVERYQAKGRTLTLKLRYADFRTITRARTLPGIFADRSNFGAEGWALLSALVPVEQGIRLLGLTLSGLQGDDEEERQPVLPLG